MDSLFLLTQNSGKILGPIAKVLGYLMNAIYAFMDKFLQQLSGQYFICSILF